jgi:DNA-directed RNA polymerase specialized sigma24 family protein
MSQPTAAPSPEPSGEAPHPPHPAQPSVDATRVGTGPGVSELLRAWGAGDRAALDVLIPMVYVELRRQARRALRREGVGHTLQPTALVHEAFLRLVELRYFAGLSIAATAAALGVSPSTVDREWAVARRWLRRELER